MDRKFGDCNIETRLYNEPYVSTLDVAAPWLQQVVRNVDVSTNKVILLSLYSTVMLNHPRWAIPQTQDFRVANTNMLVSKNACRPNANQ